MDAMGRILSDFPEFIWGFRSFNIWCHCYESFPSLYPSSNYLLARPLYQVDCMAFSMDSMRLNVLLSSAPEYIYIYIHIYVCVCVCVYVCICLIKAKEPVCPTIYLQLVTERRDVFILFSMTLARSETVQDLNSDRQLHYLCRLLSL